tara:strand:+ start:72 stop:749 length:678 start_codon:yes stop_codon:yes gene_type:complete
MDKSKITENERINALANREGIFGFGFSNNNHLDLLNLIVLACSGIVIALFFRGAHDKKFGLTGPAASLIWGYGITAVALFLMMFMSFYFKDGKKLLEHTSTGENSDSLLYLLSKVLLNNSLPIFLTFLTLCYAISLNFTYFIKINSKRIPDTYETYEFFFSILIIIQIAIIIKYMYGLLKKNDRSPDQNTKQIGLLKCITYIITVINIIFLMILHILLSYFSTDG